MRLLADSLLDLRLIVHSWSFGFSEEHSPLVVRVMSVVSMVMLVMSQMSTVVMSRGIGFFSFTCQPLKFKFIFIDIAKDNTGQNEHGCQQSEGSIVPHWHAILG
jgi:hypothetical protein